MTTHRTRVKSQFDHWGWWSQNDCGDCDRSVSTKNEDYRLPQESVDISLMSSSDNPLSTPNKATEIELVDDNNDNDDGIEQAPLMAAFDKISPRRRIGKSDDKKALSFLPRSFNSRRRLVIAASVFFVALVAMQMLSSSNQEGGASTYLGNANPNSQLETEAIAGLKMMKSSGRRLAVSTWNIAAINNNPFEYWITYKENPEYEQLMIKIENFLESPGDQDVAVGNVFTEDMFSKLDSRMTSVGWKSVRSYWESDFRDRKIVSGFMKDPLLGSKRLASMPDRITNTINVKGSEEPVFRPTVINMYAGDLSTLDLWWAAWEKFMFDDKLTIEGKDGDETKAPYEMLQKIKKSKYPDITEQEEADSLPLQTMCGAIFDSILVHMMNTLSSSPQAWQDLKKTMVENLNKQKVPHTMKILEEVYVDSDIITLQEVSSAFISQARKSKLGEKFHIIAPMDYDAVRDQNSVVALNKNTFPEGVGMEITSQVEKSFPEGEKVPVAKGDILAVTAKTSHGIPLVVASFHGDTNGLATKPVLTALLKAMASDDKLAAHRLVFGLDANTYENATPGKQQDVLDWGKHYVSQGLTSCWGDVPDPKNYTTYNARTYLQPQLNKACKSDEKRAKGDVNPKDFIVFPKKDFKVVETWKDNTGKRKYTEDMAFPTLDFPSDHGILHTYGDNNYNQRNDDDDDSSNTRCNHQEIMATTPSPTPPTKQEEWAALSSTTPTQSEHRRTSSEGRKHSWDGFPTQGRQLPQPHQPPQAGAPAYGVYPPATISYFPSDSMDSDPSAVNAAGHHRVRSWSGNQQMPRVVYPMAAPPPGYAPPNSPYVNVIDMPVHPSTVDPRRQRGAPGGGGAPGHRRTNSYGSVNSDGSAPMLHSPGMPPIPRTRSRESFSPRSELMKLTGSIRNVNSPNSPVMAPMTGVMPAANYGSTRIPYPGSPSSTPRSTTPRPTEQGGEAVFWTKSSSSRKKHLRQRSAQIFMEDVKGVEQTPSCHDIVFLLFFLFHLLGVIYLGNTYGYEGLRYYVDAPEEHSVTINYQTLIYVSAISGLFAIALSALALVLMMALAKQLVQIALILTITFSFAWGTMGIGLSPKKVVPASGFIALALSVAYTIVVWDRCKFHGANLATSLAGVRSHPGAVFIAFVFQFLALGWSIYYTYVAVGVYDAVQVGDIPLTTVSAKVALYGSLAFSYYWTLQVFLNIVQVTVAGVIGSWWSSPEEVRITTGSQELGRSFFSSCFYSLGSICFGSLLVGPVRVLRQLSALFRPSEEGSSLLCLHECLYFFQSALASCVDYLVYRFNPWGFTYVGLYGYNLMDAGLHATELFEKRGWTTIVSDDLVPNVLLLITLVIGGVTGVFAHGLESIETLKLTSFDEPVVTSFIVGGMVGLVVSSVLFGIISSSVNAVIVSFAASPLDFQNNHPELSSQMRTAWREVWPGCMDVVDMRVAVASLLDPEMSGSGELRPLVAGYRADSFVQASERMNGYHVNNTP
eukprot:Nitzschia sp. Nitz4//scaffold153_size53422//13539//19613//NITZ4_006760-RA/size53422-processed-gene-0.20-mRNA-1//-1//CDS//3329537259//4146//frame0